MHGRAGGAYTPRSVRRRLGNFCHHIEVLLLLRLAHFAPPLFSSSTAAVRAASWRFTARLCEGRRRPPPSESPLIFAVETGESESVTWAASRVDRGRATVSRRRARPACCQSGIGNPECEEKMKMRAHLFLLCGASFVMGYPPEVGSRSARVTRAAAAHLVSHRPMLTKRAL